MRVLCLDMGEVRVGVAVSDAQARVATPVCVLPAAELRGPGPQFRRLLEDWEPELLVCGLPLTMAGERGPQAERIAGEAQKLAQLCALPLEFADERLSSAEAKRILHEQGLTERAMRGKIDMIAASLTLQSWLDARQTAKEV